MTDDGTIGRIGSDGPAARSSASIRSSHDTTETREPGSLLAFQYNGGFPLAFLLDDEEVRAGSNGSAVVRARGSGLATPETVLAEVHLGEWLTRLASWEPPIVLKPEVADAIRAHVPEFPERSDG